MLDVLVHSPLGKALQVLVKVPLLQSLHASLQRNRGGQREMGREDRGMGDKRSLNIYNTKNLWQISYLTDVMNVTVTEFMVVIMTVAQSVHGTITYDSIGLSYKLCAASFFNIQDEIHLKNTHILTLGLTRNTVESSFVKC